MTTLPDPAASRLETISATAIPIGLETPFDLRDQQWQHRVLLVFAPSQQSPDYQQQMQQWQNQAAGLQERDLKLVEILATGTSRVDGQSMTVASAEQLRTQFEIAAADFAVILVGKDGTEKQRSLVPVEIADIFSTIDAMPMRQQEMRSQQGQ
ncbi:MAG TPA: DUF4174 domain-containing protein [Coleofasciculaceae cyanobacterium]